MLIKIYENDECQIFEKISDVLITKELPDFSSDLVPQNPSVDLVGSEPIIQNEPAGCKYVICNVDTVPSYFVIRDRAFICNDDGKTIETVIGNC